MDNTTEISELLPDIEIEKAGILKKVFKRFSFSTIISFLFLCVSFCTVIYYIVGLSEGYLHSDCTDSLLWAYATVESGEIIAQDFIYAAILPFSANLWMIPLIKIFGYTMKAQLISMVIFAVLFTASLIWVFQSLRFSKALNFTATGCVLMLLSSSVKMREIMWGHVIYYSLSLLLINCILSLSLMVIRLWKSYCEKQGNGTIVKFFVALACLILISTGTATNGVQVILMTVIPVFCGVFAELFFDKSNKLITVDNAGHGAVLISLPFASLLGLLIQKTVQGKVTVWYTNYYSNLTSIDNWQTNLFKFHKHFLTLIGFDDSKKNLFPDADTESILSDTAIFNLIAIVVFAFLILTPIVGAFFYKKYKHRETKVTIVAYLTLFFAISFLFVCGNISNVNWRLVPLCGTAMLPIFAMINEMIEYHKEQNANDEVDEALETKNYLPVRLASVILAVFLVFSFANISIIKNIDKNYGMDNDLHKLTAALEEHDLKYGYATFWYSQAITLLSDSKVSCRDVNATSDDGVKMYSYQTFNKWYDPQDGVDRYFVILTQSEYAQVRRNSTWNEWESEQLVEKITDVDGFYIFVFDGYLEGIK